ncbi:hypothetical protein HOD41_00660, partial [bacterium]|nr:hypothetical protein [bacterium]
DPEAKITKYEKEQSKQALSNITFAYENAFKKNLIEDLEKLVKKYEPIALEKKKQFEAEEKKATARKPQQAKSSPIVRRPDYSKTPYGKSQYGKSSYGDYSSYYDDYGNYPYNSYYDDYNYDSRPYKKKDSSSPQGGITKPTEKPKEKEIDPEEIKESKKLKKHIKEIYREFVEDFEKLEETLEDNKDLMDKFRSYLGTIGDPSPDYNTLFNELVARLQSILAI